MKKEEISDLIDMVNEQRDSCGMITRDELIKNIQETLQQDNWISVDNPPKPIFKTEGKLRLLEIQSVIATDGESVFEELYDPSEGFHKSVTHWQPLPKPPVKK